MRRIKPVRLGLPICGFALALTAGWSLYTAMFSSRLSHIEALVAPSRVSAWSKSGIRFANGKYVMPNGMTELPEHPPMAIQNALERGLEVTSDHRVIGLIHIWHWCGNDRIRYDLSRIDVAQFLTFYSEGKSSLKMNSKKFTSSAVNEGFSSHGWSVSERVAMRMAFDPKFKDLFKD